MKQALIPAGLLLLTFSVFVVVAWRDSPSEGKRVARYAALAFLMVVGFLVASWLVANGFYLAVIVHPMWLAGVGILLMVLARVMRKAPR